MSTPPAEHRAQRGPRYPLGVHVAGEGVDVAVFAGHAERVRVCVFDAQGRRELARYALPDCTDGVWHGHVPGIAPGTRYGLRVEGPYRPEDGHRHNPNKLLIEPHARRLAGRLHHHVNLHGYRVGARDADLSYCRRDSAPWMPKAVVVAPGSRVEGWAEERGPAVPWSDTVIYETHLRGLSMLRGDLPPAIRGTWAALGDPRTIEHFQRLGVTAIELLPVQAYVTEGAIAARGLVNYWGYNPLAWCAPHGAYLSGDDDDEIRRAVAALHRAGLELILDVVYNHTAEGGVLGPTLSLRGLDHASYYARVPDSPRHVMDWSGCGNSLNVDHPRVVQLILDSLRHWVREYHVDGFRFDLSPALGRDRIAYDAGGGVFDAILQDPLLARCKLIAEPWDLGPDGFQLGRHPPGFAEWNAHYRDDLRRFWRGDAGHRGRLAARLQGSAELFDHAGRRSWASVNFVTAHDGFTLADLVAYSNKHNEANGEDNRDGADGNWSDNGGVEGPTDDPAILAHRALGVRALLATLYLSHGTPMLLGGDEFGRSQHGNNNAYCQDSPLSWFDWTQADSRDGRALQAYVARLAALRRRHPSLRASRYQHGRERYAPGLEDVAWFDETGSAMDEARWHYHDGRLLALRRVARRDDNDPAAGLDVTLLLINNSGAPRRFVLPEPSLRWRLALDSADPARAAADDGALADDALDGEGCVVAARALVLLVTEREAGDAG